MKKERVHLFVLSILFLVFATVAHAQGNKVTLTANKLALPSALNQVERQSGYYKINYDYNQLSKYKTSAVVKDKGAVEAVRILLGNLPFTVTTEGRYIQVKSADHTSVVPQQSVNKAKGVNGRVTDQDGEPLIGATVVVPGTQKMAVTDVDGNFSLPTAEANDVLEISYIGKKTVRRKAGSHRLNVVVDDDNNALNDVVVTGYQTISKERAAGSFVVLTPEKMEGKLQTNILDRMEGLVAGLKRVPGKTPEIRGISTINGTKTPLYVVDGIPFEGDIDALNPADIVNVTVLKDASAASIYGARSANGVIVITTRQGEKGKTKVSYDGSIKFTPLPSRDYLNLTSSSELVDLQKTLFQYPHSNYVEETSKTQMNEVYKLLYANARGKLSDADLETQLDVYRNLDRYQQVKDAFVRSASMVHQHNLSFSGGADIYRYALSVNYQENLPYEKKQSTQRLGFNLKNQFDFFKWLRVNVGIINSNVKSKYNNGFSGYGYLYSGPSYRMIYNEDGSPKQWYNNKSQQEIDRLNGLGLLDETYIPVDEVNKAHYSNENKYYNINVGAKIKFMEGLDLDLMYQTEQTNGYTKQLYDADSYTVKDEVNNATVIGADGTVTKHIPEGGKLQETWVKDHSYTFRIQLNFNREFGIHGVQALVGAERRKVMTQNTQLNKWGYNDQTLAFKSINELALGTAVKGTQAIYGNYYYYGPYDSFGYSDNRYVAFYGNASYTYDRKLTATGSIRIDQSNLFGTDPKYQYRPLWSLGLQYLALENWNWIDRLAVRATYGINGNVAKNSGPYMIATNVTRPNSYTNEYYSYISTPPNPTLRWEKTNVFNLGVDFNLLRNRLNGSIEFYIKNSNDLLGNRLTDPTTGWNSLMLNYGSMYNRGIEISLQSVNMRTRDLVWTSGLTFSYNKNKLTKIENSGTSAYSYFGSVQNREGKPMSALYSVRYAGLDEEGFPQAYKADGTIVKSYRDLEAEDLVYSGTTNPPYSASLSNKISYKGFDVSFMFVFYGGHKLRDVAASYVWNRMPTLNYAGVMDKNRMHFWQNPGDEKDPDMAPAFLYGGSHTNSEYLWSAADKHIQKGDYLKLRDLTFGYTFPKQLISKAYLQNLRLSLQIQNLFYWAANKRHLDPEVWTGTTLTPARGYHIPATYTIGISANF